MKGIKYAYDKETNMLIEQPGMEKPIYGNDFREKLEVYDNHLKELKSLHLVGWFPNEWRSRYVIEDVDFEIYVGERGGVVGAHAVPIKNNIKQDVLKWANWVDQSNFAHVNEGQMLVSCAKCSKSFFVPKGMKGLYYCDECFQDGVAKGEELTKQPYNPSLKEVERVDYWKNTIRKELIEDYEKTIDGKLQKVINWCDEKLKTANDILEPLVMKEFEVTPKIYCAIAEKELLNQMKQYLQSL